MKMNILWSCKSYAWNYIVRHLFDHSAFNNWFELQQWIVTILLFDKCPHWKPPLHWSWFSTYHSINVNWFLTMSVIFPAQNSRHHHHHFCHIHCFLDKSRRPNLRNTRWGRAGVQLLSLCHCIVQTNLCVRGQRVVGRNPIDLLM